MKRAIATVVTMTIAVHAANTDKTLVSWVTLANKNVRAGSVLTIQDGDRFDGIVFAEKDPGKWMAGSDFFRRTQKDRSKTAIEKADDQTQVQMAIVYKGDEIRIFRNGELYASYTAKNIDLLSSTDNIAVFGLRHIGGTGSILGAIDDARIYDRALSQQEIKALEPNRASTIKPWAWWDFEGDKCAERTGRYAFSNIENGAKLENGKLVLKGGAVFVSARRELRAIEPHVPFAPKMPEPVPETWLTYHLAHPGPDKAIPADPNCAIYYQGRYHLHYIFQNRGHSFAHVSSTDMVHWEWHTTALTPPVVGHGMFSGTAFMTKEGKPAIIYHGQGSGRNQIAIAEDDALEKWSEPIAVEPLTADGKAPKTRHWDPDCWLVGDTYYALAGGSNPTVSRSQDLRNWEYLGELFHPDFPANLGVAKGEDVSCANMFPIGDTAPGLGASKWMLLCISHALGCRYYLGDFNGGKFLPEQHAMMNWARWDFFAPESLLTPDGRRVMWAWCTPWVNDMQKTGRKKDFDALMKGRIQPGIQSLPRELSLADDGSLRIQPLRELHSLRHNERRKTDLRVKRDSSTMLPDISGDTLELDITFDAPTAEEFGIELLCDKEGKTGFPITAGRDAKTLKVGYIAPPFELREGEDLTLRILIDKSMVEVFANDRQAAVAWHEYAPQDVNIRLFSQGADTTVSNLSAWEMRSIYAGVEPASLQGAGELATSPGQAEREIPTELKTPNYRVTKLEGIGYDEEFGRQDPSNVIKVGDAFHVYTSKFKGGSPYPGVIGHATSTDGIHWEEQGDALRKGPVDAWDNYGVLTPYVMAYKGKYYLYYTASRKLPGKGWGLRGPENGRHIGLAVANSPYGPWKKLPQPVLSPGKEGQWDSYLVDDAHVIVRGGKFWLYYKGGDIKVTADTTQWGVAVADSPTGPFVKVKDNPLIGGHTVCVWPHREGVAALIDDAGPEKHTVQWSVDGIHFKRAAKLKYVHTGCGPYDPDAFTNTRQGRGITWGVAQDRQKGKMCISRFDVDLEADL